MFNQLFYNLVEDKKSVGTNGRLMIIKYFYFVRRISFIL